MASQQTDRVAIDRTGDPIVADVEAGRALRAAGWWRTLGQDEHWPLTTSEAETMLRDAGQFDLADGELADHVSRQIIKSPAAPDEWLASDVLDAAFIFEQRRQWRASPSAHDSKKSPQELIFEKAVEEDAVDELRAAFDNFDLRGIVAGLVNCENRDLRIHLAVALRTILLADHQVRA